ncbi:MAG: hypothetical protein AVDCRST_MAG38-2510 [uncultured Solirubrobacteraceae bacterium]|uniref:Hydrolase n=1 Tax=uncultured Solirubrobacteraceae bacterium TaxID=1162706 RepID=A0A6J4SDK0_9ACTN|nr:MAG: hypothetical protein AVDCRST_MAG38-2510 [uncultured Solirubrobacteraceae bacterium]
MAARRFLILHGIQNRRPPGHWHFWLAERLRSAGEQVIYPQLPAPDAPDIAAWLEVLRAELGMLGDDERVVVCHSLACALWMAHCEEPAAAPPVDRTLLVAPPGPDVLAGLAPAFARPLPDPEEVRRTSGRLLIVASDADPYNHAGARRTHADPLGAELHSIPGAGHVAIEDGFGPWPAVERWCLTGEIGDRD